MRVAFTAMPSTNEQYLTHIAYDSRFKKWRQYLFLPSMQLCRTNVGLQISSPLVPTPVQLSAGRPHADNLPKFLQAFLLPMSKHHSSFNLIGFEGMVQIKTNLVVK